MLAVQDFTRLGSRAFVCSVVYKVYSYYDFGKDIKNNDKNKIKYCFLSKNRSVYSKYCRMQRFCRRQRTM